MSDMSGAVFNSSHSGIMEYDTPKSRTAKVAEEKRGTEEPFYAIPDEMNVKNNTAYVASGNFTLQPANANIYSMPETTERKKEIMQPERNRIVHCRGALCVLITALSVLLAIALAVTALTMVFLASNTGYGCNCTFEGSQITNRLAFIEHRLNLTDKGLEQSLDAFEMLSVHVTELAENTSTLLSPVSGTEMSSIPPPSVNVTDLLHNCTSRIEAQCTVLPSQGKCQTPCTSEEMPGFVAVNFLCIRLESDEQNPLIGVLDVTGGEALCLCYVQQFDGQRRTHAVDCALRVTRCSVRNLQV